jgi:hypothetical protein
VTTTPPRVKACSIDQSGRLCLRGSLPGQATGLHRLPA